ncbi:MAG: argininosuccinate synthase [Candidatus Methanomethylicota archaeon]|uniref:Argininosuccinate synthase n=1 Tax=Thermoproteota archaeon TaxID=2056631 RepID=A0A497EUY4_9CREN|nr:MAG: argininosuccinate synthase [Candidatus Verstraetearchaeota archaeon]
MRVVLAFSGGLDTSVLTCLLQEKYGAEVITLTLDLGQNKDFSEIAWRSEKLGAIEHYTIDAKMEFAANHVLPALKANALYEDKYPISSALSRPLIALKLVEIAKKVDADAVAHGCTGKGNDQVRFEITIKALAPELKIIAPVRELGLTRDWEVNYALKKNLPVKIKSDPYSIDENLWGRSIECGILEDPAAEPPEEVFEWTVNPIDAPDKPEYVTIEFNEGCPISINGEKLDLVNLIKKLNFIGGKHGVGRIDHIEDRVIGIKSREVYEAPAAIILIEAHRELEKLTLTRQEVLFKKIIDWKWTNLIYEGLWVDPLRSDLEAFINSTQMRVSGEVKVKLFKGHCIIVGRNSPYSLYNKELATYEAWSTFNQKLSEGFIELWGLQSVIANEILKMKKEQFTLH